MQSSAWIITEILGCYEFADLKSSEAPVLNELKVLLRSASVKQREFIFKALVIFNR